ncbi:hypothetical protein T265_09335 [Opisthorchis viverrini]|uniref:RWD domain-containing protein n=2 Tax=Opisthorchis viverrini TaxID=6198 RepID=A0A075A5F1_OPIVI|nr:hypothetical protein T265_09335 [Opisthorchis viverrini]KER22634.1 hypothetical protein T265_09335 [Opisthorchis viverrini]
MSDPRQEEAEVLASIYDPNELSVSDDYTVEYKLGEHGTPKSMILTIQWPDGYPTVLPTISLDSFYNGHLSTAVKLLVVKELNALAQEQLGTAMTFSLIDYARENAERYFSLSLSSTAATTAGDTNLASNFDEQPTKKAEKKVQLTKAQKRAHYRRLDVNGELPRGWNWVDVAKHLQQVGPAP